MFDRYPCSLRVARAIVWLLLVLVLLGAAATAVWWFVMRPGREQTTEQPPSDRPTQPAAGPSNPSPAPTNEPRVIARRKLEQIAVATSRYNSRTGRFPNDVYSPDGRPLLSWRVVILPELGLEALYREFRLDEPWDSEHNRKLLPRMPDVYALLGSPEDGRTLVQGLVGAAGVNPRPLFVSGERAGLELPQVTDGRSNTLVCVEAAEAVEWTRPGGLPFTPQGPLPSLGRHFGNGTFVARLDGVVLWLSADNAVKFEAAVRAMATINGDERIELP